jgi:hypothetical protein
MRPTLGKLLLRHTSRNSDSPSNDSDTHPHRKTSRSNEPGRAGSLALQRSAAKRSMGRGTESRGGQGPGIRGGHAHIPWTSDM